MLTQASPPEKPNWESPQAKLNALAANKGNWGIDGAIPVSTAAVKPRVAKELVGPWGETFTCVPWEKPEKQWIARSRPKMNFPANVLTFQETGAFNEGGWAKSNPSAISEMKNSAIWIAISLCLVLQFSISGTYSMRPDGSIQQGTPLSIATSKTTGESLSCVQRYRAVCFPSGFSDDAPLGFERPADKTIVIRSSKK
mmetsp:Transcript_27617/g.40620  ORF Transcript_27617/g.40620 Transcript_27617/m.40620 type:complete len:198 (+) Transcript_27617:172-765(+)